MQTTWTLTLTGFSRHSFNLLLLVLFPDPSLRFLVADVYLTKNTNFGLYPFIHQQHCSSVSKTFGIFLTAQKQSSSDMSMLSLIFVFLCISFVWSTLYRRGFTVSRYSQRANPHSLFTRSTGQSAVTTNLFPSLIAAGCAGISNNNISN